MLVIAAARSGELACGQIDRRSAEKRGGAVVGGEQRTDFVLQLFVAAAGATQKDLAVRRRNIERGLQEPYRPGSSVRGPFPLPPVSSR